MPQKPDRSVRQQSSQEPANVSVPDEVVDGVKRVYRAGWKAGWKAGFEAGQQYYRLEFVEKDDDHLDLEEDARAAE